MCSVIKSQSGNRKRYFVPISMAIRSVFGYLLKRYIHLNLDWNT